MIFFFFVYMQKLHTNKTSDGIRKVKNKIKSANVHGRNHHERFQQRMQPFWDIDIPNIIGDTAHNKSATKSENPITKCHRSSNMRIRIDIFSFLQAFSEDLLCIYPNIAEDYDNLSRMLKRILKETKKAQNP